MTFSNTVREFVELAASHKLPESEIERLATWAHKGVLSVRRSAPSETAEDFLLYELDKVSAGGWRANPERLAEVTSSMNRWPKLTRKAEVLKLLVLLATSSADEAAHEVLSVPAVYTPSACAVEPQGATLTLKEGCADSTGSAREDATPEEMEIRRQLSFCLQGSDSDWFRYSSGGGSVSLTRKAEQLLNSNEQRVVLRVAELGKLYRSVTSLLQPDSEAQWDEGLLRVVKEELKEAESLAVLLDSDTNRWSLLKINAWCYLPVLKMRAVNEFLVVAKEAGAFRGGKLVNLVYPASRPGMFCREVFASILDTLLPRLYTQITLWVTEGVLPSSGLFVAATAGNGSERFKVVQSEIPDSLITTQVAEAVLKAGKSVRFLRDYCGEKEWLELLRSSLDAVPVWKEAGNVDDSIVNEFKTNMARLLEVSGKSNQLLVQVLREKYKLEEALRHLHDFVLVGRGDFAQAVADVGGEVLSRSARSIRRHELLSILDQAMRLVGVGEDVANSVSLGSTVDASIYAGDVGWDVFSVQVPLEQPLDQILSPSLVTKLNRVGKLAWKFVHAELTLSEIWRDRRWSAALFYEVWHVVHNMRAFFSYEIIGHQWLLVQQQLKLATDLDQIHAALLRWTDAMLEGCFLMSDHLNILDVIDELLVAVKSAHFTEHSSDQLSEITRRLVQLLETPKPPGKFLIFDDLHESLVLKLSFNDFFKRAALLPPRPVPSSY